MRPLEITPVQADGKLALLVHDPLKVIPGTAVLSGHPLLLLFLQMADGTMTTAEMAGRLSLMSGEPIPAGLIDSLARQLDEALLLQSARFRDALHGRIEAFRQADVRAASLYRMEGVDRLSLLKSLGEELRRHRLGPQAPPDALDLPPRSVRAVLAPHIDYQRGGPAYAWAYQAMRDHGTAPRTWFVLGTLHHASSHRFIATRKNFETPLGLVETDRDALALLEKVYGHELYRDEFAHAGEHTIEIQAVYLRHIFGDGAAPMPKIVPILVGSFHDLLTREGSPRAVAEIGDFCDALRAVLDEMGDEAGLIGSVDLSHCGPRFGHECLNDPERVREIESADRAMLDALESGDPDRFFDTFRPDLNARNVCSIAAIYCVMEVMRGRARPRVLTYQHHNSEDLSCLVSFTSVAFVKSEP